MRDMDNMKFYRLPASVFLTGLVLFSIAGCQMQKKQVAKVRPEINDDLVEFLLRTEPEKFKKIYRVPEQYRAQVLLSVIEKDDTGGFKIDRYGYRLGAEYFYPASTIKLGASVAALQYLQDLDLPEGVVVDAYTPMEIYPLFEDESHQFTDTSNVEQGVMTVGHEIRRTLLVSSNSAFNHLFEIVGQQEINEMMMEAGLDETKYIHRLSEIRSAEENRMLPQIGFHVDGGEVIELPVRKSSLVLSNQGLDGIEIGRRYMQGGEVVEGPMNFEMKNRASLRDLQDVMLKVVLPDVELGSPAFRLKESDRDLLLKALSEHPLDSKNPVYTKEDLGDWIGDTRFLPGLLRVDSARENWMIYEKSGTAYGFSLDNTVVMHKPSGKIFALAAVLYTNENETLNDDHYEYDFADAVMADLGELLGRYVMKD
ncbi:serine hydrolase [Poriferisphaera sp. WC338]|uniref:serine hydrolase n=1 Tax=Poriferisphaera sp. WC338 TaxID=3425129 RepID=UPI003D815159